MNEDIQDETFAFDPLVAGAMRLGSWGAKYNTKAYQDFIEGCIALGIRDFDHADIYGHYTTEAEFGEVLKSQSSLRDQLRIITKCGIKMPSPNRPHHKIKSYDLGRQHIINSVEQSLKNFHTDRLDVLLLHRPDVLMDPYEIAGTFDQLKADGKVLHFGVSNFTIDQFHSIQEVFPLVTNQIEISVMHLNPFQDGTLQQCMDHQIQPMAWSPLGGGGLLSTSDDPTVVRIQQVLQELSKKYNCSEDQLLYAFVLAHPAGVVPVLGTTKIDRVKKAVEALDIVLEKEDWYQLWTASVGTEVP